jgi:hypothetical protein
MRLLLSEDAVRRATGETVEHFDLADDLPLPFVGHAAEFVEELLVARSGSPLGPTVFPNLRQ